jgi:hypothetical protein
MSNNRALKISRNLKEAGITQREKCPMSNG